MAALLHELVTGRCRAELLSGGVVVARGALESMSSQQELLVELKGPPPTPEELKALERQAVLEAVIDGITVRVASRVQRVIGSGEAQRFRLAPPSLVTRLQRRAYFRVPTKQGSEVAVTHPQGRHLLPVVDVSAGGVCALAEDPPVLSQGLELPTVQLLLLGEDALTFPGVVRYVVGAVGPDPRFRCGIELLPAREVDRDRLFRAVARREREILGRRQHLRAALFGWVVLATEGARSRVRRLLDLSAGGLSFELEQGDEDLEVGQVLPVVEFRVGSETPYTCRGVVRRIGGNGACAIELKSLDPGDQAQLDEFVRYAVSLRR